MPGDKKALISLQPERGGHDMKTAEMPPPSSIVGPSTLVAFAAVGLYLTSRYEYLLFHSLVEIFTMVVAFGIFAIAWNARGMMKNDYLLFLGIAYLFVAAIDLLHTLAYSGMGVFPGRDANLPTQLWIAARYLQAGSLLIAPLFLSRRLPVAATMVVFVILSGGVLSSIFYGEIFPDCYVLSAGLTPFKKISEYVICAILLGAMVALWKQRGKFERGVFLLMACSIASTIASELAFTLYASVTGMPNLIGHLLKVAAFYFLYKAIIETGLKRPHELLFRDLEHEKQALQESSERYRALYTKTPVMLHSIDRDARIMSVNDYWLEKLGYEREEVLGRRPADFLTDESRRLALEIYVPQFFEKGFVKEVPYQFVKKNGEVIDTEFSAVAEANLQGEFVRSLAVTVDVTERNRAVAALKKAYEEVEARVAERTRELRAANELLAAEISEHKLTEERLRQAYRRLRALSLFNEALVRTNEESVLLDKACRIIVEAGGYRMAWIGLAQDDAKRTVLPVAQAGVEEGYIERCTVTLTDEDARPCPMAYAISTGKVCIARNVLEDPSFEACRHLASQRDYVSLIVLPLMIDGHVRAGLEIWAGRAEAYDRDEVELLEQLAEDLAFGIGTIKARAEREKSKRALAESEARYRAIVEDQTELVCRHEPGYKMTFVNGAFCRAFSKSREELLALNWLELVEKENREDVSRAIQSLCIKNPIETHENRTVLSTGEIRWYRWTNRAIFDHQGNIIEYQTVGWDITERKASEEALARQTHALGERVKELNCLFRITKLLEAPELSLEQVLQGIVDVVPPAFQFPDLVVAKLDLNGLHYSSTEYEETEFSLGQAIVIGGSTVGKIQVCYLESPLDTGETLFLREEEDLLKEIAGRVGRIFAKTKADEALRASEERFRAVFEGAQDFMFIKDTSARYTHVNPAVERLLGLPATKILGRTAGDLFDREAAAPLRDLDMRVLQGEEIEGEFTRTMRGIPMILHEVRVPLRNRQGAIVGICEISRDITDWKKERGIPNFQVEDYPSPAMKVVLSKARAAAERDITILLLGESGAGKDHLARYIHDHSPRSQGPFFTINCAAVPSELAESELFGHERGAFTGAQVRKKGLLELAEGGTLLLNEVGELSPALQAKLLSFLDTRQFTRVGGEKTVSVKARIIAATNKDLETEIRSGRFRQDLFYRLNVMVMSVPPLRERREDIPIIAEEIISRLAADMQLSHVPILDETTLKTLTSYNWPGNVRELRNVLERALILWEGEHFRLMLPHADQEVHDWSYMVNFPTRGGLRQVTSDITRALCSEALRRSGGNRKRAADMLGIARDSLYRYLKEFGLESDRQT